ncbi:NADH-quinone oxidoreductase subunit M [Geomonas subterranea]|uniref:NADH-quinone oxidoreductase subunit M n=1 Tax=Geomonas subterranea TaxID=2847989 RepID=A0ABX8LI32_9BACT|nr:NADH-quinone oxidoreductase subunit M [Geomonas subterranea]QXE89888.1 NADH-quinone oxidoreductase subunit M [Geomonas subterranea]QXM07994.1 NADH-quinone oxidoreductase subunit M [Geomonas subterranea]
MTSHIPILTLLVFLPLFGSLLVFALRRSDAAVRWVALAFSLAELALCLWPLALSGGIAAGAPAGFFLYQDAPWIERFGIRYTLGMDGISLVMTLLTAFITLIAVVSAWRVRERAGLFFSLLIALEAAVQGLFLSLDLFLFYLFWEAMLIPMLFLIGVWGSGRPVYSTIKFFLYTFVGSLLMLVAIITLYLMHGAQSGSYTFALPELVRTVIPYGIGLWLFAAFLLSFAIKFPLFPLHTWQPDAYCDAPVAGTLMLGSLLSKTAAYGLIRIAYPLFPEASRALTPLVYVVAVFGIGYFAWIAFAQRDMKRMLAYSSVSHMGFVALGIAAWSPVAVSGALLQMVNHAITTGALFLVVGMLEERADSRDLSGYGGTWGKIPVFSFFFLVFNMASAGVPGLNNFVSELIILVGTFRVAPLAAAIAFLGTILTLVYTVRLVQEVLFGKEKKPLELKDLSPREAGVLAVMALLVVGLGVHPGPVLELFRMPLEVLLKP